MLKFGGGDDYPDCPYCGGSGKPFKSDSENPAVFCCTSGDCGRLYDAEFRNFLGKHPQMEIFSLIDDTEVSHRALVEASRLAEKWEAVLHAVYVTRNRNPTQSVKNIREALDNLNIESEVSFEQVSRDNLRENHFKGGSIFEVLDRDSDKYDHMVIGNPTKTNLSVLGQSLPQLAKSYEMTLTIVS